MARTKDDMREVLERFVQNLQVIGLEDEEEQRRLLEEAGEDPRFIRTKMLSLEYARQACIKRVNIGRWRAGTTWDYNILGVNPGDNKDYENFLNQYLRSGAELLLPAKYIKKLNNIESLARRYLREHSFDSPWGPLVPFTVNRQVNEQLQEYRQQYFAVVDEIVDRYDQIKKEMEQYYRIGAKEAWRRLNYIPPNQDVEPPAEWENSLVGRIMAKIITPQQFRDSCYFNIITEPVPVAPSVVLGERMRTERIQQMMAALDVEEQEFMQERERRIKEIEQEVAQNLTRQLDEVMLGFFQQIRVTMYETCLELLQQKQKHEQFSVQNRRRLSNMIKKIRSLNDFLGDTEIDSMLESLKGFAIDEDVNDEAMARALKDVATMLRADLMDLGNVPRSGREVGIPEKVTASMKKSIERRQRRAENNQVVSMEVIRERRTRRAG